MDKLDRAVRAAASFHAEQKDKGGRLYLFHPLRVMLSLFNDGYDVETQCAGVLHDTVEDTGCTLTYLRTAFTPRIVDMVDSLSRRDGETYNGYIDRLMENKDAIPVKMADVQDNLSPRRLNDLPKEKQLSMIKRYQATLEKLALAGDSDA